MTQMKSLPNTGKVDIVRAFREGLITAFIALLLFAFIVGFRADLNLKNEMTLTPQIGYLINYVIIAGIGRFTWCLFGGGTKGAVFAIVPSVILFVAYRAWLYYEDASAQSTYNLSAQAHQLLITGIVLVVFVLLAFIFLYAKGLRQAIRITVREVTPGFQKYAPGCILALLLVYPFLLQPLWSTIWRSHKNGLIIMQSRF